MTVKELIERLSEFPDYHEVRMETEGFVFSDLYPILDVQQRLHGVVLT